MCNAECEIRLRVFAAIYNVRGKNRIFKDFCNIKVVIFNMCMFRHFRPGVKL